jgi:hypothetical protein
MIIRFRYFPVQCESLGNTDIRISWLIRETPCFEEYGTLDILVSKNSCNCCGRVCQFDELDDVRWVFGFHS